MRFETNLPCDYTRELMGMPPFDRQGNLTQRVLCGLENSLYLYSSLSKKYAKDTENNSKNFLVKGIMLVGSGAKNNEVLSDLDILLLCPDIDEKSAGVLKHMISYVLFCDRDKNEAVDVFIRPKDKYPERSSVNITSQVNALIERYNNNLR